MFLLSKLDKITLLIKKSDKRAAAQKGQSLEDHNDASNSPRQVIQRSIRNPQ